MFMYVILELCSFIIPMPENLTSEESQEEEKFRAVIILSLGMCLYVFVLAVMIEVYF
ncbi:hypothetical protein HQ487_05260 [Candidatus Uhrbacteria bacterium]|nr:hypothetical protein [Candidatus Uhrbacteria bacterium]